VDPLASTAAPTTTTGTPFTGSCGKADAQYQPNVQYDANGNIMDPPQSIVGGNEAVPHSWPYQVKLLKYGSFSCGGTLISDRWIVSAAHCFSDTTASSYQVQLGMHGMHDRQPKLSVDTVKVHEQYNQPIGINNDIALLRLSQPVQLTDKIRPVCLPPASAVYRTSTEKVVIAGWGTLASGGSLPSALQQAIVELVPNTQCQSAYSLTDSMMCAASPGRDSCQGDSGGPLMSRVNGSYVLAGIVSHGMGCAMPNYPGVYTHVPTMRDWIRTNTGV
jgi:secreted trypsin-like serine protease